MRVRRSRRQAIGAAIAAAAVLATIVTAAVPAMRSAASTSALRAVLRTRGYDLRAGQIHIGADRVDATGVQIDDAYGKPVLTADSVHAVLDSGVWLGRSERRYGLVSLDVDRPVLHLVRL